MIGAEADDIVIIFDGDVDIEPFWECSWIRRDCLRLGRQYESVIGLKAEKWVEKSSLSL